MLGSWEVKVASMKMYICEILKQLKYVNQNWQVNNEELYF